MSRSALAMALLTLFGLLPAAHAGQLGRLFYTPQQRLQAEYQEASANSAKGGQRNSIIVNGIVQKKGGNRTVWVNGVAQPAERSNGKAPSAAPVNVPGKSRAVRLKVGQRLLLENPAPEQDK